ncbi:hypothetical protein B6N60_02837 [Richelia sinica FACHB-800]|uniref:Uncharacterized protein n=1 Tax=Richelia sinica FACHB-800 TaxID=1357546 RepID=A0A975Y5E2_9NOST|nr:hypothetical protein B6N60_02837 [Richelia sinica FACHB-800]
MLIRLVEKIKGIVILFNRDCGDNYTIVENQVYMK